MQLKIFWHKDWLIDFFKYYEETIDGKHKVSDYIGENLWQKTFFAWCSRKHNLGNVLEVSSVMFGDGLVVKGMFSKELMERYFNYDIVKKFLYSRCMIDVE